LQFREIDDGVPRKTNQNRTLRPKTLHIKIDKREPVQACQTLERLYSSLAQTFPLGIKMRLVHDHKLLTNTKAKAKAASLWANQEHFLKNMETCISCKIATIDLPDNTIGANLWHLIMNIPNPNKPTECLFHAVNKMFHHDGYIFCFNPSKSQCAREIIAGLLVFLQGTWKPMLAQRNSKSFSQVWQLKGPLTHGGIPKKDAS